MSLSAVPALNGRLRLTSCCPSKRHYVQNEIQFWWFISFDSIYLQASSSVIDALIVSVSKAFSDMEGALIFATTTIIWNESYVATLHKLPSISDALVQSENEVWERLVDWCTGEVVKFSVNLSGFVAIEAVPLLKEQHHVSLGTFPLLIWKRPLTSYCAICMPHRLSGNIEWSNSPSLTKWLGATRSQPFEQHFMLMM